MDEKFKEDLLQYLVSVYKAECASARLIGQIDAISTDQSALKPLFLSLESVIDQFKSQSEVIGLVGTDLGWRPVIKLLHALLINSNDEQQQGCADVQLKKRALHVLAELVPLSTGSAIGPHLEQMVEMALAQIDGDTTEKRKDGDEMKADFEHLILKELHGKCPSSDLRLGALRALGAIFDTANLELPYLPGTFELHSVLNQFFPRLLRVLLAILADKEGGEEMRNLSNKCISMVIANYDEPNAIFAILSDMSANTELMLKDDPLLDDLIEKCWARDNKLMERSD